MPTLKDLNCSVELSDSHRTLQEFGTTYSDGCVETFVAVPSKPGSFSIHLTSDRFIAPGISMYVFVDGVYQCNRNRQDLKLRKGSGSHSVVDFRVRQKEEKQKDGSMIAREWRFDKLDTTSADHSSNTCSQNILDALGCIEVLVLRCTGPRNAKTTSAMNLDGASDFQPSPYAVDDQTRTPAFSAYDDRGTYFGSHRSAQAPPAPTYRSPYAETLHSHNTNTRSHFSLPPFGTPHDQQSHSTGSGQFSSSTMPTTSIPSDGIQYGSGPIPRDPMHGPKRSCYRTHPTSAVVANAPGSDPAWLNDMLTKAAKRGVEEYRPSEPPGAWPQSPYMQPVHPPTAPRYRFEEDTGSAWGQPVGDWSPANTDKKSKAQVRWDTEPVWDSQSASGDWGAPEDATSDTWDTDETWEVKKSARPKGTQRTVPGAASVRSKPKPRHVSPDTSRTRWSQRPSKHHSRRSRSISRSGRSVRGDKSRDDEGWLAVDPTSNSTASSEASDTTVQLSRAGSHGHRSRKSSKSHKHSHRTKSTHRIEGRSSKHLRGGADAPDPSMRGRVSSMASGGMSEIMNAPFGPPASACEPLISGGFPEQSPAPWVPTTARSTAAPQAPFSTYEEKPLWELDSAADWGATTTAENFKNDWAVPPDDQDSWEVVDPPIVDTSRKKYSHGWDEDFGKVAKTKRGKGRWDTHEVGWATEDKPTKSNTVKEVTDVDGWAHGPSNTLKAASKPKRHTNKSLSRYRHSRPSASPTGPKPHWQFPPPSTNAPPPTTSPTALLPAEPRLKVPSSIASSKGVSHQVRAGPGSSYGHMIGRPTYLDTLDKPYAVFRFKYRSRGLLKELFGDAVLDKRELTMRAAAPAAKVMREKEKLEGLGREELVERMVRLKMEREEASRSTESMARGLTERWVERQSRDASE
ncbi:hypothetical protein DE146DRAFT_605152 [Phaeosphaeria sp. MPI-PUGE-AT-0046c]|nr:hypothetical protein DE146DRAFT_605152 [Phaeosphaeria sp. MPI-PUGE-AT-0046c]